MFDSRFTARTARVPLILLFAGLSSASCASTETHALVASEVHGALDARANGSLEELEPEQIAGLDALALPRPTREECAEPRVAGYWRACALAWNPGVRAARRELQRALAEAGVAGKPDSIDVDLEIEDLGDWEEESTLAVSLDLLGLLGVGPAPMARKTARIEVRRARAALESAVWSALFEVQRARVRLASTRARIERLNALLRQVAAHAERFEVLERRGRLSEADARMAVGAAHEVEHALSHELGEEMELRAALTLVSGVPFDRAAYASIGGEVLAETRAPEATPDRRDLLEREPRLRELALEYAKAEMHVRHAATEAWPTLRVGPQLKVVPSDVLLGGVLDLSLPWPGRVAKEVRIASVEREAARERVEDALNAALARVASLTVVEREARMRAFDHGPRLDEAQEAAWQAANARLRLGMTNAVEWTRMLRERIGPLLGLVNEQEEAALAALDLAEARGIAPSAAEVTP